ncbi:hypothetical protein QYE76_047601 [Lolium multiflorum]|uniref:Uncharacterized protein n=1 Tax=Lolium multiflorum TaxID=4521 RepID=A0AAD8TS72_LOLMU|nr:hypothetical protein QYE76_047601 [Lolium multiflorum]
MLSTWTSCSTRLRRTSTPLALTNQTHAHIIEQGEAIKLLNNDRKSLRQQRAKKDATIARLRAKIASLEATVKAQEDQIREMEDADGGTPDETDTTEKRQEILNGHDEMQTVLVNIPFADLEALVDSAIQMEGKLNQANENRKHRIMHHSGSSNAQKYCPSSSGGFTPRNNNKPPMQNLRPGYQNRSGGNSKPGGYNNNNYNNNNYYNRAPPRAPNNNNNNPNTAPRTGSNAIPVATKDKATITCYECGVVGHYSRVEARSRSSKVLSHAVSTPRSSPPTTPITAMVVSTT